MEEGRIRKIALGQLAKESTPQPAPVYVDTAQIKPTVSDPPVQPKPYRIIK